MKVEMDRHYERKILREPGLYEYLYRKAQNAAVHAMGNAPSRLGYYRRSIYARPGFGFTASAEYGAHDFKAWWVEFGAKGHNRAHSTLRNAGRAVGLKIREVAKRNVR